jgi:phage terminase large subunit
MAIEIIKGDDGKEYLNVKSKNLPIFDPLNKPARFKGAYGGRGSGKSHYFAEQLVLECIRKQTRAVGLREIQNSIDQSSKLLIEDKIRSIGVAQYFDIRDKYIGAPWDGIITFQGMQNHTAETVKGLEGYRIAWFDEAQRASKYSLGLLRPTMRLEDAEMWFSWNPQSPDDPIDQLLRGPDRIEDAIVVEANYDDNEYFPESLRREMEHDRRRDPERYKHVWLGEYASKSQAAVFKNWRIEEFTTPDSAVFYHGCDWGFAKDPTVLVRCFLDGRKLYVDREAWEVGCEMDRTPFLFDYLDDDKPFTARKWTIVADSANPQAISYMRRHGYPKIVPSMKGKGSVEEGIEFLKSYDIIAHPRCKHVIDELMHYQYKVDKLTEAVLPKLADEKNHTIDALRYALEQVRRKHATAMWGSY